MAKSLLKTKADVETWRELPGLLSYVECDDSGRVSFKRGAENEELPMMTNSFLQLGRMLGKSLGIDDCEEVLITMDDRRAFFAKTNDKHVGLEYHRQS